MCQSVGFMDWKSVESERRSVLYSLSEQQMKTFIRLLVWWRGRGSHLRTSSSRWWEKGRGFIKLLLYLPQEKSKQRREREWRQKREWRKKETHLFTAFLLRQETSRSQRRHSSPQCWGCYVCVLVIGSAELWGFKGILCIVMKWLLFLFH